MDEAGGSGEESSTARRRPVTAFRPCFTDDPVWLVEPWSIWCDWRRHRRLLDVWIGQVRFYENNLTLISADEAELSDRFLDVTDARAALFPECAGEYRSAAERVCAGVAGRFLPKHVFADAEDNPAFNPRYYVDRHLEERPSAWQAGDAIIAALEVTRPLYDIGLPAPRRREWSVGADLTMAWVHTVALMDEEGYFRVPDPSDPMGIFEGRWFAYEDYLTRVDPDLRETSRDPGPDSNPLQMDYFPVNGPVYDFIAPHAEAWMLAAYNRAAQGQGRDL